MADVASSHDDRAEVDQRAAHRLASDERAASKKAPDANLGSFEEPPMLPEINLGKVTGLGGHQKDQKSRARQPLGVGVSSNIRKTQSKNATTGGVQKQATASFKR